MNIRKLFALCATISLVFVLALTLGAMMSHGSVSKANGSNGSVLAGSPVPPNDDDTGNVQLAGSPVPPNDDDTGNVQLAGSPVPPNDDDTGNVRVASVAFIRSNQ